MSDDSTKKSSGVAKLSNEELRSSSFWLSQLFMIAATIMGVYLAASTGLQQALQYGTYQKMEDNYYLRMSLYDEVSDNAQQLRTFVDEVLAKSRPTKEMQNRRPNLDRYVWTTMQYSPTTLETPSRLLSEIRRFYAAAERIMDQAEKRFIGAKFAAKELEEKLQLIEEDILPALKTSAEQLQQALAKDGIEVGSLKQE